MLEGSTNELVDALRDNDRSVLAGVDASGAASATLRDDRLAFVGRGDSADVDVEAAVVTISVVVVASGDAARGVAAGPGVGGVDRSERGESPPKVSIAVVCCPRAKQSCRWVRMMV